jgi:hypothetical protein
MGIQREDEFLVFRDSPTGKTLLGLESNRLEACAHEYVRAGYTGVFGSPAFSYKEPELEVLKQLPELRQVWFWDVSLKSTSWACMENAHPLAF